MNLRFGSGEFDLAHCSDVLQHLPTAGEGAAALAEMGRVLGPGGLLIVRTNATPGLGEAHGDPDYPALSADNTRRAGSRCWPGNRALVPRQRSAITAGDGQTPSAGHEPRRTRSVQQHGPGFHVSRGYQDSIWR